MVFSLPQPWNRPIDRFERIYQLHRLLCEARYPLAPTTLCERLACSRATLYRSIADLRDGLGAPIVTDPEHGGVRYAIGERFELPGLWFSPEELHALLSIQQLLARLGPGLLERELQPLRERIERLLAHQRPGGGDLAERLRFLPTAIRGLARGVFRTCASAVLERHRLRFHYHGRSRNTAGERSVSPQRLTHYRDNWYLDAWCHDSRGPRRFALDRISTPRPLKQSARELDPEAMERHFGAGYGIFGGPVRHLAVLRFSPDAARWVADESWHPDQQGRFLEDGRYELRIPYGEPTELVMDVLRHGAAVEVVAPPALRRMVIKRLREALGVYSD